MTKIQEENKKVPHIISYAVFKHPLARLYCKLFADHAVLPNNSQFLVTYTATTIPKLNLLAYRVTQIPISCKTRASQLEGKEMDSSSHDEGVWVVI